ncbi:hypothetical protein [Ottowia sp. VDI28]|uniref:hypothetical protein n=1 Tax=Ottowia sp. VDI28 TaxID=3133968 RepID=UPI003C2E704D
MPYVKTALAAEALRQRSGGILAQRQRTALILFDGKRSVDEVLRQTAGLGVQPDDITHLVKSGLLQEEKPEPANSKSRATSETPKISESPAPQMNGELTIDEQQRRYKTAYPLATQLTATLGLRGFKLNLAVERAEGYAGLRELLPKIEAAVGPERATDLRAALDGAAR